MEKLEKFIGPGTAGISQRISTYESKQDLDFPDSKDGLYILKPNKVVACGHNQY